jgi:hypothetical protein
MLSCHAGASGLAIACFVAATAACGNPAVVVDAAIEPLADAVDAPRPSCWPMDTASPRGSIELGTGSTYRPMPDELPLVFGDQSGFHIEARSRIQGLEHGDPVDVSNPTNPRTRFRAFFTTGPLAGQPNVGTPCATRVGYLPDGTFLWTVEVRFDTTLGPADLFDKQFRVVVEIIDSTGAYAIDEKLVTARAPIGWNPMTPDAGP